MVLYLSREKGNTSATITGLLVLKGATEELDRDFGQGEMASCRQRARLDRRIGKKFFLVRVVKAWHSCWVPPTASSSCQ